MSRWPWTEADWITAAEMARISAVEVSNPEVLPPKLVEGVLRITRNHADFLAQGVNSIQMQPFYLALALP